jgi:hypothetical protein
MNGQNFCCTLSANVPTGASFQCRHRAIRQSAIVDRRCSMIDKMTDEQRNQFEKHVSALLRARWNTVQIRDWAVSAASGFGRFWESPAHALDVINVQCRRMNAEDRRVYNDAVRSVRASFPTLRNL